MGCGARIPKPTGHIIPPDVWNAPVHSAGSSPRHRPSDLQKPPATMANWRGYEIVKMKIGQLEGVRNSGSAQTGLCKSGFRSCTKGEETLRSVPRM